MNIRMTIGVCLLPLVAHAELDWRALDPPARVFGGRPQRVALALHNPAPGDWRREVRYRLWQASSHTAAPATEPKPWKTIRVLAGQTIIEQAQITFPEPRERSLFVIQWLDGDGGVLGRTKVLVYPGNLLQRLHVLANSQPVGVWEPSEKMAPLLRELNVEAEQLKSGPQIAGFAGALAIVGPFRGTTDPAAVSVIKEKLAVRAGAGLRILWLHQADAGEPSLLPSAYLERIGEGAIVHLRTRELADLADSPHAQLNLLRAAEMAIIPGNFRF